jgi:hypothetical protein
MPPADALTAPRACRWAFELMRARLRVPDAGMFRLEEPWKERIDAKQSRAGQRDNIARRFGEKSTFA